MKKNLKCPNCGSSIDSFVTKCPYCNSEIKNIKSSKTMKEFSEGIQKILSYKKERKESLLKKTIGIDLNEEDHKIEEKHEREEKLSKYITSFPIPNSKEDLTEFMILSTSRLKEGRNESQTIKDAWKTKVKQIYEKAKISITDQKDFSKIEELYENSKVYLINDMSLYIYYYFSFMVLLTSFIILALYPFIGLTVLFISLSIGLLANYLIYNNNCIGVGHKTIKIKKKVLLIICGVLLLIGLMFLMIHFKANETKTNIINDYYDNEVQKYDVEITIEFEENIIFNRFDVDLTIYDKTESLTHGQDKVIHVSLPNGKHKLKFTSADGEIYNSIDLLVEGNTKVKYHLSCHFDEIRINERLIEHNVILEQKEEQTPQEEIKEEIKEEETTNEEEEEEEETELSEEEINELSDYFIMIVTPEEYVGRDYKELEEELKSYGCTNIKTEAKNTTDTNNKNNTIAEFTINGSGYESFTKFKKDALIKIVYWSNPNTQSSINKILYPDNKSKLGKDYESTSSIDGSKTYLNVDNKSNVPKLKKYEDSTITDGVYEYLEYLKNKGFNVEITKSNSRTPYSGFTIYETDFRVYNDAISWTMNLMVENEKYVEYEFYINVE